MEGAKSFLLGVGCQKGGTTWLHDYLGTSGQVDLGFAKEYHVFDALDLDFAEAYRKKVRAKARKAVNGKGNPARQAKALRSLQFQLDPESYFDYFQLLLLRRPAVRLSADITPSYAGLGAERFAFIRQGFAARGVPVRVIFLMRDPVERIWSSVRMNYREHTARRPNSALLRTPQETVLLRSHKNPPHAVRTRYDLTIAALEQVFTPDEIHYEFYERLFSDAAVARICDFLGIAPVPADFGRRLNASPKSAELPEAAARTVARSYRAVYEALGARFGAETLAGLWPNMRLL
jgi:hypothetical protein